MILVENFLTNNPCYKQHRYLDVKGLMLHSVGCACPKASRFLNSFNSSTATAMVHGFIDAESGAIYQTAPWNMRCWHGASGAKGSSNNTMIGVEMCEPPADCIKYVQGAYFEILDYDKAKVYVDTAYNSAVDLFAYLCEMFNFDPLEDGIILSHREGSLRGIASNHGDPDHLLTRFGYSMNGFRTDVAERMDNNMTKEKFAQLMNEYLADKGAEAASAWATNDLAGAVDAGITDGTRPQAFSTRQETAAMIYRAMLKKGDEVSE